MSFSGKIRVDINLRRPNRPSIYLGENGLHVFNVLSVTKLGNFIYICTCGCVHYPMAGPIKVFDVQLLLEIDRYVLSFYQESFFSAVCKDCIYSVNNFLKEVKSYPCGPKAVF